MIIPSGSSLCYHFRLQKTGRKKICENCGLIQRKPNEKRAENGFRNIPVLDI
jgi:hypothetical protein